MKRTTTFSRFFSLAILISCALGCARAGSITVPNFSFESPVLADQGSVHGVAGDTTTVPGWTIRGTSSYAGGIANDTSHVSFPSLPNGNQYAFDLFGPTDSGVSSITTTSPVTTIVANTNYTLTVQVGSANGGAADNGMYTISLIDTGGSGGPVVHSSTLAESAIPAGTFAPVTLVFSPPAGSIGHSLNIKLAYSSNDGSYREGVFDNVQLTTSAGTNSSGTTFNFTLPQSYTTSAGVYDSTGKLVRTLWRKIAYTAGAHTAIWDNYDDNGNTVASGTYTIKVLYHNVQYVWDGVIANTSASFDSSFARHGLGPITGLAVNGSYGYETRGNNEGQQPMYGFNSSSPQSLTGSFGNPNGHPDNTFSLGWNYAATDGSKVYFASQGTPINSSQTTGAGVIVAFNCSDNSSYHFTSGTSFYNCPDYLVQNYPEYTWPNGVHAGTQSGLFGLAVQTGTGTYLAASVTPDNLVYLLDKTSGAVVKSFAVTSPKAVAFAPSGDLWVLSGTTALRYTNLTTTPTLATTISGFSNPLAVAVHPTNSDIVLVADGGTSQQVKGYTHTGTAASGWSTALGTLGGNKAAGPAVTNTKFWFTGGNDNTGFGFMGEYTYLAFNSDGSFWLGDNGNNRTLHFNSSRTYIEQIAFLSDTLQCSVDPNNPGRVFAGFLEYQVDYTKPLQPGDPYASGGNHAWKLVNNWAYNVGYPFIGFTNGLKNLVTLSNGHTYGIWQDIYTNSHPPSVYELASTGVRTYVTVPSLAALIQGSQDGTYNMFELEADGSIRYAATSGGNVSWYSLPLTGFDGSYNPQWGAMPGTFLGSATAGSTDPTPGSNSRFPITSSNVLVSFNNGTGSGWHLGGINVGATSWLWKASPSGPMDFLGTYDPSAEYAGDAVMASDKTIVYGYNGEFGYGGESCQFMHFYDDGLFVGQFGVFGNIENPSAGYAGNASSPQMVKVNGEKYLWHNDESAHGGLHRWHLLGDNNIQEATGSGTLNSTITVTAPAPTCPINVAGLPGSTNAVISWSPVPSATAYKVKYSTTRGGPYTILSSSVTATNYTKTGLTNATNYYFVVSAVVGGVESNNSNEVKVRPFPLTANVVAVGSLWGGNPWRGGWAMPIVSANVANNQPALAAVAFSDILGNLVQNSVGSQGYVVFDSTSSYTDSVNLNSLFTVTKDSSWTASGDSNYNFTIDGTAEYLPSAVSTLALTTSATSTITVATTDNTNWHLLTVCCPQSPIHPGSYTVSNYTVTLTPQGLTTPSASYAGTSYGDYWYQFIFRGSVTLTETATGGAYADIQALFIDPANIANTPAAPTGLTATAGTHQVSLAWPTVANATSYNIYRGTTAGGESTTAIATNVTLNSYTDTGLTTGTHYYYKIKAVNGVGTSGYSNEANATSL